MDLKKSPYAIKVDQDYFPRHIFVVNEDHLQTEDGIGTFNGIRQNWFIPYNIGCFIVDEQLLVIIKSFENKKYEEKRFISHATKWCELPEAILDALQYIDTYQKRHATKLKNLLLGAVGVALYFEDLHDVVDCWTVVDYLYILHTECPEKLELLTSIVGRRFERLEIDQGSKYSKLINQIKCYKCYVDSDSPFPTGGKLYRKYLDALQGGN